jgi:hypothetical protein
MKKTAGTFQYDNLNFFQLSSILSASLGLSAVIVGKTLATQHGAGTAICSLAIGNLILWLIATAIITMVDKTDATAIDNIKSYLSAYGGIPIALIFMMAFLGWYASQIDFSIKALNGLNLYQSEAQQGMLIRVGAVLGLFSAMLAMGGIHLLRVIAVCAFPAIFLYYLYTIVTSSHSVSFAGTWGISFQGIVAAILVILPGVINFPTVFRHSRSKAHSFLSLTLFTILITSFEASTIWMDLSATRSILQETTLIIFIISILTLTNLMNVYMASASWASIIPKFGSSKGFAIIGLLGTLFYTFIQISAPMQFLQNLTNAYIAVLGIVLLIAYLLRILLKHRPRPFEKMINLTTWLVGCVAATIYEWQHFLEGVSSLLAGVSVSLLFLLCVLFIEETLWATRKKFGKKMLKLNQ